MRDRTTAAALPDLARIPAGDFLMGSSEMADERPVHRVHLSEFFISRFEVSHDEYARFVRATDYRSPSIRDVPIVAAHEAPMFRNLAMPYEWRRGEPPAGRGSHPVVLIGYDDAAAYCRWLSAELKRTFRLPTEAEWERAARGGIDGKRYPWGDEIDSTCANYLGDPASKPQRGTRPAGTYAPNGFGLCDMAGNVWEWVSDWYSDDYYASSEASDPRGPDSGAMRVVRGGSWVNADVRALRCACRHPVPPDTYAYSIGFRVVCEA
jgi:formylglycine-generating enzyme required for sulfatase activity